MSAPGQPGDEHDCPSDKGQGGSCRKAGLGYNATVGEGDPTCPAPPVKGLQGDPWGAGLLSPAEEEKDRVMTW